MESSDEQDAPTPEPIEHMVRVAVREAVRLELAGVKQRITELDEKLRNPERTGR